MPFASSWAVGRGTCPQLAASGTPRPPLLFGPNSPFRRCRLHARRIRALLLTEPAACLLCLPLSTSHGLCLLQPGAWLFRSSLPGSRRKSLFFSLNVQVHSASGLAGLLLRKRGPQRERLGMPHPRLGQEGKTLQSARGRGRDAEPLPPGNRDMCELERERPGSLASSLRCCFRGWHVDTFARGLTNLST